MTLTAADPVLKHVGGDLFLLASVKKHKLRTHLYSFKLLQLLSLRSERTVNEVVF